MYIRNSVLPKFRSAIIEYFVENHSSFTRVGKVREVSSKQLCEPSILVITNIQKCFLRPLACCGCLVTRNVLLTDYLGKKSVGMESVMSKKHNDRVTY